METDWAATHALVPRHIAPRTTALEESKLCHFFAITDRNRELVLLRVGTLFIVITTRFR